MADDQSGAYQETDEERAARAALDTLKAEITAMGKSLSSQSASDAESNYQWMREQCKTPGIDNDFKVKVLAGAQKSLCYLFMKETNDLLNQAVVAGQLEHKSERNALLRQGQNSYNKSCSYGADEEYRTAALRLIEIIDLTGGMSEPGKPTKAKPLSTAPENPNDPKSAGFTLDIAKYVHAPVIEVKKTRRKSRVAVRSGIYLSYLSNMPMVRSIGHMAFVRNTMVFIKRHTKSVGSELK